MKKRIVWGAVALVTAIVLPIGVSVFSGYQDYLAATKTFVLSPEQKAEISKTIDSSLRVSRFNLNKARSNCQGISNRSGPGN